MTEKICPIMSRNSTFIPCIEEKCAIWKRYNFDKNAGYCKFLDTGGSDN